MRGALLMIIMYCVSWLSLPAQTTIPEVDSLQLILTKPLTDSARALVLAELAYRYYIVPDSAYAIAMRGLKLSTNTNFERGIAANRFSLAAGYYANVSAWTEAMDNLLKAIEWEFRHGSARNQARCYLSMGFMLGLQGEIAEAIGQTKKANTLFRELGDVDGTLITLNNLGYLHTVLDHYDSAQNYLLEGIEMAAYGQPTRKVELTGSLAELYLKTGDLSKAKGFVETSIRLNKDLDQRLQSYNMILLARIYLARRDTNLSVINLQNALVLAQESKSKQEESDAYKLLSDIFLAKKNPYAALESYRKSVMILDDIMTEKVNLERQQLKNRLENVERESRITILEQEKALHDRKLTEEQYKNQLSSFRLWLVALIAILILSVGALFVISLRSGIRKERFKLWKREQVLAHEFAVRLANSELIALKAQMNPHFIFNSLNSINRYIIKSDPLTASSYLTRFSKLIRLILENSMTLKVPLEKELHAVELYLQMEALRFDHKFSYKIKVHDEVNRSTIDVFPLIMQPYVENAIWHGLMHKNDGLGHIEIRVELEGNALIYSIEDNGIGREKASIISSRKRSVKKSFGLQITHERLKLLASDLHEEAACVSIVDLKDDQDEGIGTRVIIRIPLSKKIGDQSDGRGQRSVSMT